MTYILFPSDATGPGSLNEVLMAEDVSDLLSNLFPLDNQLQDWCEHVSMAQTMQEQPVDTYGNGNAITRASSAYTTAPLTAVEGADPTDGTEQYPFRLRGVSELHMASFKVSGTVQNVEMYGITDRYVLEALKYTRKVANDFEMHCWWGQGTGQQGGVYNAATGALAAVAIGGADADYKRVTQGLIPWVTRSGLTRTKIGATNITNAHGDSIVAAQNAYAYDANNINLDAGMFEFSLMNPWWDIGGEPEGCVIFCSPKAKTLAHGFMTPAGTAINERKIDAAERLIINNIDAYETQFGMHYLSKSRYLNINSTVALKYVSVAATTETTLTTSMDEVIVAVMPSYWKIGVNRPIGFSPLAKTGDSDRGMITCDMGFLCKNTIAGAAIVNCVA